MASPPSNQHADATDDLRQEELNQEGSQRQGIFQRRPRFLRAITSPIPSLRDPGLSQPSVIASEAATSSSSPSSMLHQASVGHTSSMSEAISTPSTATAGETAIGTGVAGAGIRRGSLTSSLDSFQEQTSHRPSRPQLHPIQMEHAPSEGQLRSFSTSSVLPPFLPSTSSTASTSASSSHSRNSITETLKEHRWSKGLKLNWMPSFNSGRSGSGLEGAIPAPSPMASSSRSSVNQQKPVQRRKSEGAGLRISRADQGVDSSIASPSLGLAPVSITGKSFSRSGKAGIETSVDQLKVSEARTRRISDSGLSTSSSKLSGTGLAERLSGFAATVRSLSRPSFTAGNSPPTMNSSSSCSTPTTPGFSPQCVFDPRAPYDQKYNLRNVANPDAVNRDYESWDDFLYHYRLGQFPADCPLSRPSIGSPFPPMPPYVNTEEDLPYMAAPLPSSEERRLRALYGFQIIQSGADPNFERIVQLVATVMGVRGCMITLVDHDQVTVKAPYSHESLARPRQESICGHTILRQPDDPFVVLDTKQDWRFQNLPSVTSEPFVGFYAGAPLTTSEGLNVGALCLIDSAPRTSFTDKEKSLLVDFAAVVMREMELWNDQVQLCIRNRMMRDVTRWVRGCLHIANSDLSTGYEPAADEFRQSGTHPSDTLQTPLPTSSGFSISSFGSLTKAEKTTITGPTLISPPVEPVFPTPSGSPTLLSCILGSSDSTLRAASTTSGNPLWDKAFPSACILIQATLNVDAVYLVQASSSQAVIPPTGSSIVWNYLDAAGRRKGSVGIVKGGQTLNDLPSTALVCLASSQKNPETQSHPLLDEKVQHKKKQGSAWVCTDEGCRPHRIGDSLLNAVEPVWERDSSIIKEMLGYVRQEVPIPPRMPGQSRLFTCSHSQEVIENDWFGTTTPLSALKDHSRRRLLCHTFQGTLPSLSTGTNTPYHSCEIVPISGPNVTQGSAPTDGEPWAYFVIFTASRTKQFTFHERIYLKNFGSCLVTEVMKRRVEAADKAKGTFIKSISHELRTPLHIILGILELLYANPEEPLSETQLGMVASAEASGKNLIDTINNIIDFAKLDPDSQNTHGGGSSTPSPEEEEPLMEEVDIRELCERVAESMAKTCTDKNLVMIPSVTKPSLASLTSSVPTPAPAPVSVSSISASRSIPIPCNSRVVPLSDETINGYASSADSQNGFLPRKLRPDGKPVLELIVAVDEPEKDPQQDTSWSFVLELKTITRILTQLVENAIKFTTTGYVEISATSLVNSPIPMKPPHPDAKAILFTVRDTGKGISAEFVQSHLFKTFSQEDPLQVGTGLGMALVKALVEKLGGWMEVWSEGVDGKGCVVKVLIWASPASHPSKSLKDMAGPWQEMSCRFYAGDAGESTVGSDRLFKVLGERMMRQQLNMNVERGDEEDICSEDMFRDLSDQSPCDLLVINDDLSRLKAYLSHWTDYHHSAKADGVDDPETPIPLLMLTAPPNVKGVQKLVDEYLETQIESNAIERPATVVIMTKPLGPLKLVQCLRECFTPAFDRNPETSQSSPVIMANPKTTTMASMPMIRSATVPHITTASLGVHDNRLLSAGSIIKQSFVFPQMPQGRCQRQHMVVIPPHSPGGLVIPPRILSFGLNPATTPEQESCPDHVPSSTSSLEDLTETATSASTKSVSNGTVTIEDTRPNRSTTEAPKLRPQRSIRNYQTQRRLQLGKAATAEGPVIDYDHPDGPLPRVLIVEDNLTNRMILRTFLKKRGISVVEAENGLLGVQRFEEEVERRCGRAGFEFVLMDLQMPVLDGNEATRQIRQFEQKMVEARGLAIPKNTSGSSQTPVTARDAEQSPASGSESGYRPTLIFALTGLAADEDKRLAFECGVDGYLTKPVSLKTLGSLLSNCQPPKTEGVTSPAELQSSA